VAPLLRRAALALALLAAAAGARSEPARRVVSLNPSLTAILLAVGAREAIVGVDSFSARQEPEVAGLPAVGGLYNPSLEAVVALAPDLVVYVPTAEQRDFQRRMGELGVPVQPYDPVSFEDVLATIGAGRARRRRARARGRDPRGARRRGRPRGFAAPPPRGARAPARAPLRGRARELRRRHARGRRRREPGARLR
jgi:iron complex transport system substrate-binding protein